MVSAICLTSRRLHPFVPSARPLVAVALDGGETDAHAIGNRAHHLTRPSTAGVIHRPTTLTSDHIPAVSTAVHLVASFHARPPTINAAGRCADHALCSY